MAYQTSVLLSGPSMLTLWHTRHSNYFLDQNGEQLVCVREHAKQINDIQPYKDLTMIATASKDTTAKLFDTQSFKHLKTYKTERPVNSASISPIRDHVVLGGGQEAMDVTTTSTRIGKFDARFFHLVFEEEFGRVKGHFGPINSVVFSPDGKRYVLRGYHSDRFNPCGTKLYKSDGYIPH
ncbi:eukaryotic translation initiation factor 3 subunit I-like [Saccoglossus kowalevskii]|uniref:Eukaryotic translation initiation factor 3 subunit I-like n=1 Tax=Saccoglossus kowalevskii TaxID=10224 RepID=A0ABM0GPR5_SACKO|nr:PREDICTED: eukaryotic translation initiation factor 3 subunit I-like [Saccoglossus kowalevskii]